jgi:4-amino-4-deoxy-L-arabinose transferase-like glycosyltransferase
MATEERPPGDRSTFGGDVRLLVAVALLRVLLQAFTNDTYGFFRDELVTLDDSRHLDWGYVAYPPLTPFVGRVALALFGLSLNGVRFFPVLVQGIVVVLVGLMARDMGARRFGQVLAAVAVATTAASVLTATLLQYVVFDYLAWVLVSWCVVRLLATLDARWWLGIGAAVGLGVMTKYTIGFWVAGIVVGLVLTGNLRWLRHPWPWAGALLALAIALPNLVWQARHEFVSLAFLRSIHERDVQLGRARGFLLDQLLVNGNAVSLVLIAGGLYFLFAAPGGRRFRMLGWMYATAFVLFLVLRGRGYYLVPAYPVLVAGGAVWLDQIAARRSVSAARRLRRVTWAALAVAAAGVVALTLPTAPVHSPRWRLISSLNENLKEEIGWPELVETVTDIYARLPPDERPRSAVLAGDGAEAGAINLLGRASGLPRAISGFNSHWLRGCGDPPPETVIAVGLPRSFLVAQFESCELAGRITNRYGISNEETTDAPDVYVCRRLRKPWPEFWKDFQSFG